MGWREKSQDGYHELDLLKSDLPGTHRLRQYHRLRYRCSLEICPKPFAELSVAVSFRFVGVMDRLKPLEDGLGECPERYAAETHGRLDEQVRDWHRDSVFRKACLQGGEDVLCALRRRAIVSASDGPRKELLLQEIDAHIRRMGALHRVVSRLSVEAGGPSGPRPEMHLWPSRNRRLLHPRDALRPSATPGSLSKWVGARSADAPLALSVNSQSSVFAYRWWLRTV